MIPTSFDYHRAASVSEAIQMLQEHEDAKLLAGGHSLLAAMKLRLNSPSKLIDISRIPELNGISEGADGSVTIGGACTHAAIAASSVVQSRFDMLANIAGIIGDVQVRNKGTIGGSLAHADPAADWPAGLLATDAVIHVQGPGGSRSIAATDFFEGFYTTALQEGEIITAVHIPASGGDRSMKYLKFVQPASRFAIVGCAVNLSMNGGTISDIKLAFTGVSDVPFRDAGVENAMNGKEANAANIEAAAAHSAAGKDILGDHFASEEYRGHLAKVYARKAITAAAG